MRRHLAAILIVLAASVSFQAWFLGLTPHGIRLGDAKLSDAYTVALGRGQSYLLAKPDPRLLTAKDPFGPATQALLIWDTSFFHGHYYMYFGIVPFAVFMVPWLELAGVPPSPELAILVFSIIGYLAYGGILLLAVRRYFQNTSAYLTGAAFLVVVVTSSTWPLMGRPAVYEIENAAAFGFFALSMLFLAQYEFSEAHTSRSLAVASAFAGLTMGCRPNYFPAVTVVALWILYRSWRLMARKTEAPLRGMVPIAPLIIVGIVLGYWNYHRFGSPLDFGLRHTVSDDRSTKQSFAMLENIPYHFHRYVFGMPRLSRYFPFIQGQKEGPIGLMPWQEISNQVYGCLIIAPILAAATLLIMHMSSRKAALIGFCVVSTAAFLGNFIFLCSVAMSCYRYPADFLGPLSIVSALGVVSCSEFKTPARIFATSLVSIILIWSASATVLLTFSIAQNTELFDKIRTADFHEASVPFNQIIYWYETYTKDGPRYIALKLYFPKDKYGRSEPLAVFGANGAQDFIYLYYAGAGELQIGFESSGLGGPLSPPIQLDYNQPHSLDIYTGAFLPPDNDPLFRGVKTQDISLARKRLIIRVDEKTLLDEEVHFHSESAQTFIGQSPFDSAFGTKFTGLISNLAYPKLKWPIGKPDE